MRQTQLRLQKQWFQDKPKPIPVLEKIEPDDDEAFGSGRVIGPMRGARGAFGILPRRSVARYSEAPNIGI